MFAGAPGHGFSRGDIHLLRAETGSFVRSVAKGLAFGPATGAPPILAWFNLLNDGRLLGNDGFAHASLYRPPATVANENIRLEFL
jgi:hypothetical protein